LSLGSAPRQFPPRLRVLPQHRKLEESFFGDHDKLTSFALQGLHKNVRCEACHKEIRMVEGEKVLFYKPTPKQCEGCHGPGTLPAGKS
jgi:hypothetical protein